MSNTRSINKVEIMLTVIILMVIAGAAVPSFTNKNTDTQIAAVEGVAGSLSSASAINYAVRSISNSNGVAVKDCVDVAKTLEGSLDTRYKIPPAEIQAGEKLECVVISDTGLSASFTGHGIL